MRMRKMHEEARPPSCSSRDPCFGDGVGLQPTQLFRLQAALGYQCRGAMAAQWQHVHKYVPEWAEELTAIVRLHTQRGTLVMGWEKLLERLVELGLASEQQVLPQCKRLRGPARS